MSVNDDGSINVKLNYGETIDVNIVSSSTTLDTSGSVDVDNTVDVRGNVDVDNTVSVSIDEVLGPDGRKYYFNNN